MDKKICNMCRRALELSEFYKRAASPDGLQKKCKQCTYNYQKEWEKKNPGKKRLQWENWSAKNKDKYLQKQREYNKKRSKEFIKNGNLITRFGITLDQYNEIIKSQNNKCAICQQELGTGREIALDHDHTTGKIRKILCKYCNLGLGYFMDNQKYLLSAVDYLNDFTG